LASWKKSLSILINRWKGKVILLPNRSRAILDIPLSLVKLCQEVRIPARLSSGQLSKEGRRTGYINLPDRTGSEQLILLVLLGKTSRASRSGHRSIHHKFIFVLFLLFRWFFFFYQRQRFVFWNLL